MKTTYPSKNEIPRKWHLVDANNQVLGRLASQIARTIQGKGKPFYAPHLDCGDFVVVINADKVKITGKNKPTQKIDFRHSGYPGGHTITPYGEFLKSNPERAVELAVTGMLPKNKIRSRLMKRLKVYKGDSTPHGAQFAPKKKAEPKAEAPSKG